MDRDRDQTKARLLPLYLRVSDDPDFLAQTDQLTRLLNGVAVFLPPRVLGSDVTDAEADAVVFPQLTGDAYQKKHDIAALGLPILVLTSEFGTMAMWDWEIISYLRAEGVDVLAPYSIGATETACRSLAAKRQLREGKFIVYQDRPGQGGKQPEIFKRFYWWEDECSERIRAKFGLTIEKRSFRDLGAKAKAISESKAEEEWERWRSTVTMGEVARTATLSALKLYHAVKEDFDAERGVLAIGINCLNESVFSDTTPCLAWNLLYQELDMIWGCEADTVSMLSKFVLHRSLRAPIMMSNLYPFLMGGAALKHERLTSFPMVDEPEDYVLAAHCGYLGVVPQPFATEWELRGRVLEIVDSNATAIDARLPVGDLTLAKLDPTFQKLVVAQCELTGYAQYPGSDCRNGAVIHVPNGHALMERLPSHHSMLLVGHDLPGIKLIGQIFGLGIDLLGAAQGL